MGCDSSFRHPDLTFSTQRNGHTKIILTPLDLTTTNQTDNSMSLNTADKIFLAAGIIDFCGIFVWIGVCLHIAHTKMNLMLEHLKYSSVLRALTPLRHGGPWGKLLLVGGVSSILTFPRFYLNRRSVSAEDLRSFPASLKRKLVILQWFGIGLLLTMISLAAAVKFGFV
jgi:hypothetical protein